MFKRLKERITELESSYKYFKACMENDRNSFSNDLFWLMNNVPDMRLICDQFEKSSSRFLLKKDGVWKIYKRGEKDAFREFRSFREALDTFNLLNESM